MIGRWLRLVSLVLLLLALYFMVPVNTPVRGGLLARLAGAAVLLILVTVAMVRQLRLSAQDEERHVDGLVLAIVAMTLAFALAFYGLESRSPGEVAGLETRLDSLYFTMSTMLTVGYGDVHASGQTARGLVVLQMLFNVLFVATAAGLLTARVRRVATDRMARRTGGDASES